METRGYGYGHFCTGCPRSNAFHEASTCIVNRPQTPAELAKQGLKAVYDRNGRQRIIEIDPHPSLSRTLAFGLIGLMNHWSPQATRKIVNAVLDLQHK